MTAELVSNWQDSPFEVQALLFDLDGTLIDSAPDLAGAVNEMRLSRGMAALPLEALRPHVGSGARGMLGAAFQMTPDHANYEASKSEFLDRYEARMARETQLFDEVLDLLGALQFAAIPWGIVTNKAERFALPLTHHLGLHRPAFAVIGGDTTPHAKPHPAPLLEAASRGGVDPRCCVYIGDDERDMIAGRAAGMRTIAAGWGYLGKGKPIEAWNADIVLSSPSGILKLLGLT